MLEDYRYSEQYTYNGIRCVHLPMEEKLMIYVHTEVAMVLQEMWRKGLPTYMFFTTFYQAIITSK